MNVEDLLRSKVGQLPGNRATLEQAKAKFGGFAQVTPIDRVGELEMPQPKPHPIPALDPRALAHGRSKKRVAIVATLISMRRRELDEVNLIAGFKPLQDTVAASLGCDDRDRRIKWEFRQVIGEGPEGTIVKIDRV